MDAIAAKLTRFQNFPDYGNQNQAIVKSLNHGSYKIIPLFMHIIAQSPRFVIRDFKPQEEDHYLAMFDDERVTLHLPARTKKEQLEIFIKALTDYATGRVLGRWGIFSIEDGELMGMCLLRNFYDEIGKIELGYSLNHKYWGKGIASEVAMILIGYGFTHTEASEIVAVTTLENYGSQKVLEKAGLTRLDNFHRDGEELAYFSIKR
jgi:[ribosomal protein S5]-alanine N-acetyltransferase